MSYPSDEVIQVLRRIEGLAVSIQMRAKWLDDEAAQLLMKPSWPTKAEDELDASIVKVGKALADLQAAKKRFAKAKVGK